MSLRHAPIPVARRLQSDSVSDMSRIPVSHVMKLLGMSRQRVLGMIAQGRLDAVRNAHDGRGSWLVSVASVESLVREQELRRKGITTRDAAHRLGVTERQVRRYAEAGDLIGVRVGNEWRLDPHSVTDFVRRPVGPQPKVLADRTGS